MSWLPAMMWMHMLNDDEPDEYPAINILQDPEEQESTGCNARDTPVVAKTRPPVTDSTPTNNNNAEDAPTVAPRAWHHTAMSAATFALSTLLGYIATEAICKRIRGRN